MREKEVRTLEAVTRDSLSEFAKKMFSVETRRVLCIQGSLEKEAAPVHDCVACELQRIISKPGEMHDSETYVVERLE